MVKLLVGRPGVTPTKVEPTGPRGLFDQGPAHPFVSLSLIGTLDEIAVATDRGYTLRSQVTGLNLAPREQRLRQGAGSGAVYEGRRYAPREIDMTVWVSGSTLALSQSRWERLARLVDPWDDSPVWLEVLYPDGRARRIQVRYTGGAEGDTSQAGDLWPLRESWPLTFTCPDPFFTDRDARTVRIGQSASGVSFLGPGFPRLSQAQVIGRSDITNPGDVEAWPVWTVTGPGAQLVLRNFTTGRSLTLNRTLTAGQQVVVDTAAKTVRASGGVNAWPDLAPGPQLWPLAPGGNDVDLLLTDSTATSSISVSFRPRYKRA